MSMKLPQRCHTPSENAMRKYHDRLQISHSPRLRTLRTVHSPTIRDLLHLPRSDAALGRAPTILQANSSPQEEQDLGILPCTSSVHAQHGDRLTCSQWKKVVHTLIT